MDESYFSVSASCSSTVKIEGSKFIADVFPVETEIESEEYLHSIRKKYFDATHHCYAYAFGVDRKIFRSSDDGEPSGTAGLKILSAIQSKNLSDILVIVTRYFGGTKLGVGGLGRAYFDSSASVLSQASIIQKCVMQEFSIRFPFSETNAVMNLIHLNKFRIMKTKYDAEETILTILLKLSQSDSFTQSITNATRGKAFVKIGERKIVTMG